MPSTSQRSYEFGPFRLDAGDRRLTRAGAPVTLTPKAADVLLVLLEHAGTVVTKEEFRDKVWSDTTVENANLTFQIHLIRRALGNEREYVESVPRRGYRFLAPVTQMPDSATTNGSIEPADAGKSAEEQAQPEPRPSARRSHSLVYATGMGVVTLAAVIITLRVVLPAPVLRVTDITPLTHDREAKGLHPLLVDDARVYLRRRDGNALYAASVAGDEQTVIFNESNAFHIEDVNQSRAEYLAIRGKGAGNGEVWILPMISGMPHPILGIHCDSDAAWSTNAQQIACVRGSELYVVKRDGTGIRKLPTPPGMPAQPRWSPDGTVVRFTLEQHGDRVASTTLWEVRASGTGLRRLLPGWDLQEPPAECCGTWTPDGGYFIFQATSGRRTDLWALRERRSWLEPATTAPVRLTTGPLSFSNPVVSSDGTKVFALGKFTQGELVRYDVGLHEFVSYLGGLPASWLSFSPDKRWVTYVSYPDTQLWRARVDGSARTRLVSGAFDIDGSTWSPDGKWIAFRSRMTGQHMKIYLIPSNGGTPRAIISDDREQGIPSWSPDGTRLVFGDVPVQFGQPQGDERIEIYDVARQVFSIVPGSEGMWTCRWSPDRRYLAALTIKEEEQRLRLFDFASRLWRALPADHVDNPTWSHDGKFVYYDTEGPSKMLRRVDVTSGRVEDLKDLNDYPLAAWSWSGLTPDDSPLVLRDIGAVQVYALKLDRR